MTGETANTGGTYTIKEENFLSYRVLDDSDNQVAFSLFRTEAQRIITEDLGGTLKEENKE